jgi:hypothetical protein
LDHIRYCRDTYGATYGTARIEDDATLTALSETLMEIQTRTGYQLGEVTTAERTAAKLDAVDIAISNFNPSGEMYM